MDFFFFQTAVGHHTVEKSTFQCPLVDKLCNDDALHNPISAVNFLTSAHILQRYRYISNKLIYQPGLFICLALLYTTYYLLCYFTIAALLSWDLTNISLKIKKIVLSKQTFCDLKKHIFLCSLFLRSWFNVSLCFLCSSDVPFSGSNITFSLLTPEPNLRPGYNDFYNNPALQKMVHATQIRIHLRGQYHTSAAGVNQRHRYYAISEITISGRWGVTNIYREMHFKRLICFWNLLMVFELQSW